MDPISVGFFVAVGVVVSVVAYRLREVIVEVAALKIFLEEVAENGSKSSDTVVARVTALELENRTIKADIAEIKASRRAARTSGPGSMRAFRNQLKGTEIE